MKKQHILIIGGDTILNLLFATFFARNNHKVSIINDDENKDLHFSKIFLDEEGHNLLRNFGFMQSNSRLSNPIDLIDYFIEMLCGSDFTYYGNDYRKMDKGRSESTFKIQLTPSQRKKKPSKVDLRVYRRITPPKSGLIRLLPKEFKRIQLTDVTFTVCTTPPSFIEGIQISHRNGFRVQSYEDRAQAYYCECALRQIEDFSDTSLFEKTLANYIKDIEHINELSKKLKS